MQYLSRAAYNQTMVSSAIAVALLLLWMGVALSFDSLVKLEYSGHWDEWVSDGRPRGLLWVPIRESAPSLTAFWFLSVRWAFVTPLWMRADARAKRLLYRYRILLAGWCIAAPLGFLLLTQTT